MECRISLEPMAEAVNVASTKSPLTFELSPSVGREKLEETQNQSVLMCPAGISSYMASTGTWGGIPMYLVTPECAREPASVIFYAHGVGWTFGNFYIHEELVWELAARTGCTAVFPEYSRSPEACHPVAIERCFSVLLYPQQMLSSIGVNTDSDILTVAGGSVDSNMTIAMALMTKYRRDPRIQKQLLYCPATNACFDTGSYREFAGGYYLHQEGMKWFWNRYAPSPWDRSQVTAPSLCIACEQLKGLPEALVINGEADVFWDEDEAYARTLRCAGVSITAVRFQVMIHDSVMLHSLDQTNACRAATDLSMS